MVIYLKPGADADLVKKALIARGQWVQQVEKGRNGEVLGFQLASFSSAIPAAELERIEGVARVGVPASEHPRVDAQGPRVSVSGTEVGGGAPPVLLSGPCAVESEERIHEIARQLAPLGVSFLRGGAYKPRTSPYNFQGHGAEALRWLRRAADAHGLKVVTEAMSEVDVPLVAEFADLLQIGSRNMQNFSLLKAAGRSGRPVLLKRAMSATVEEWLLAGEYLLVHGAPGVIFCERGIRGFDGSTRNLLDLGAVALLSTVHRLPVVVDPSHATGRRDLVLPLAKAALAAGAAGVMIETHDDPSQALSDGPQALLPWQLRELAPFGEKR
ncbi:MAG: 3-deoxy-7-phosphoheptulonate synthase [Myxococcales bacterium]|nr:3-deoxy-7-phosphoheptulonate synthase [Polyangiaceae bacterium]MDW8247719.1 3-deoxy-7-phosphoheptulonate synthase [Myxococcales bacterium]